MLTKETNELLTSVVAGTPMGELLRRYWHPVAASSELEEPGTKEVRILGEDLVLFKDLKGRLGLVQRACAHRRVNLAYGIPEEEGLRCAYHGWMYDVNGQCVEQPYDEVIHPDSRFKDRVRITAYPVQELGGLVFAYLGPEPVPLLPRWDLLARDNMIREIDYVVIPCNWLQIMENSVDTVHTQWLHCYYGGRRFMRWHRNTAYDVFEHGIMKRRLLVDEPEDSPAWQHGHPLVFPNMLRLSTQLQIRVPVDDTHTLHFLYSSYAPPPGVEAPRQQRIPFGEVPILDEQGRHIVDYNQGQDMMAWVTQGPIAERNEETLGESDRGITLFRRMLQQQLDIVKDGGDPMNVFRDASRHEIIDLPGEESDEEAAARQFGPAREDDAVFKGAPNPRYRPGATRRGLREAQDIMHDLYSDAAGAGSNV